MNIGIKGFSILS